jgi:hypothetical protein
MSQYQSKNKTQGVYRYDWAVREESLGHIFKFIHNTLFETFWRIIEAVEGDIWWYHEPQMKSDVVLSEKEDFPKM